RADVGPAVRADRRQPAAIAAGQQRGDARLGHQLVGATHLRGVAHEASTRPRATAPGSACTQRILRLAVSAPKTPATTTQPRKNTLIDAPPAPSHSPHARPA